MPLYLSLCHAWKLQALKTDAADGEPARGVEGGTGGSAGGGTGGGTEEALPDSTTI